MEMKRAVMSLMLVIMVVGVLLMEEANGQTVCGVDIVTLFPCLPSVKQPNPTPPTPECCGPLGKADLKCLCGFATSPLLPQYGIDPDLFKALPAKCGLPACA